MYYMSYTHTITSKGQVTVPKEVRTRLGLRLGGKATFRIKKSGEVVIERPKTIEDIREILKHPKGAVLTPREEMVLEGMEKDGHKAFRRY